MKIFWRILISISILLIVVILAVLFFLHKSTVGHCEDLVSLAKNEHVQERITLWVKREIDSSRISEGDAIPSGGRGPGRFRIERNFDWSMLGMEERKGQIRLLGPLLSNGSLDPERIKSVSFSDRSRASILVRTKSSADYGVRYPKDLTPITERIAVFCAWD